MLLVYLVVCIVVLWKIADVVLKARLRKVENPKPHFAADKFYYHVKIDGVNYLFTEEALKVARDRAEKHK